MYQMKLFFHYFRWNSDHIDTMRYNAVEHEKTFNLGRHEYRSYKYVPYGEVDEVMPYLLRRARENSSIVGGAAEELSFIGAEMKQRFMIT